MIILVGSKQKVSLCRVSLLALVVFETIPRIKHDIVY